VDGREAEEAWRRLRPALWRRWLRRGLQRLPSPRFRLKPLKGGKNLLLGLVLGALCLVALFLIARLSVHPMPKAPLPTPALEPTATPTAAPTPAPVALIRGINLNLGMEPSTIDPALAVETAGVAMDELLFLGLTDIDDETSEARPELATHWEVSEDGLTWTFHMRRDAYWVRYDPETGEVERLRPVTAHDVEYGVKRSLDPRTGSDYAYEILHDIKGAEIITWAKVTEEDLERIGVKAIDDYTVQFTLEHPAGYFPLAAGRWVARPQPREAIEQYGKGWTEPGKLVTNGPYVITAWERGEKMVMEKNPHYYDADKVSIERINWVMVEDLSEALAMYERGELDVTEVPTEEFERVRDDPVLSKELHIVPRLCTYYYGFTNSKPPFDNHLVRKAFSAAIDRRRLIDEVLKGPQRPANTFTCPGVFGNAAGDPEIAPWILDYELGKRKAKEWLAEAGYPDGEGFPEVVLMHNVSEGHRRIAESIAAMWEEVLGVKVRIKSKEWKEYFRILSSDTPLEKMPHVWRLGWCHGAVPDANDFLYKVFHSEHGANYIRWENPRFDELVEEAATEMDPARRRELYKETEEILCEEEAAIAPIYYYARAVLTKPWLERTYSPTGAEHIERWRIKGP